MPRTADFSKLTDAELLAAARAIASVVTSVPNPLHFSQSQIDNLASYIQSLENSVIATNVARNALAEKYGLKTVNKDGLAFILGLLYKQATADLSVTDEELASVGFPPRRKGGGTRPTALPAPTGVTAIGSSDGSVRLSWQSVSRRGLVYRVETSADGYDWTMIDAYTRKSVVLTGYAPGIAAWFRVTAKAGNVLSPASGSTSVYAPEQQASAKRRAA